jgi:hypothetical protein
MDRATKQSSEKPGGIGPPAFLMLPVTPTLSANLDFQRKAVRINAVYHGAYQLVYMEPSITS